MASKWTSKASALPGVYLAATHNGSQGIKILDLVIFANRAGQLGLGSMRAP